MPGLFQEISTLLIKPPGNLIYHIVLAFSIAGALPGAFHQWRSSGYSQARRMVIGLVLLLIARLALFLASGLAWQGLFDEHLLLPSVDRAITLFSLILICWLWLFPEPSRFADAATILLGLFTLTLAVLNGAWWYSQGEGIYFNGTLLDKIGEAYALTIILLGLMVLLVRKPNSWGIGAFFLCLVLAGHIVQFLYPFLESDYPAAVRLFQLLGYPLLLALPQRFTTLTEAPPPSAVEPAAAESRHFAADPELVQSLFALAATTETANLSDVITSAISHVMLADLCLFVSPPAQDGQIIIHGYYDLIRQENRPGAVLLSHQAPVITAALRHARPLRLTSSAASRDLESLSHALKLDVPGNLLSAPIISQEGKTLFALILLSPHSGREWTGEDQATLSRFTKALAQLLQHSQSVADMRLELEKTRQDFQTVQLDARQAKRENESLLARLEAVESSNGKDQVTPAGMQALISAQEEAQETIARLQSEIERLQSSSLQLANLAQEVIQEGQPAQIEPDFQGELRLALEEIARLRNALVEADQIQMESRTLEIDKPTPEGKIEAFATIAQELRQPISSIMGYSDFLLGESVGILGTLQRKFLERIRVATQRMTRLIDDLIQVTNLESATIRLSPEPLKLKEIIGKSARQTAEEYTHNGITLQVEMPDSLPELIADRTALTQVVTSLLENAGKVTSEGERITLRVEVKGEREEQVYVLLQVTDQGGGVQPQDLTHVFSRLYRAPIPGVGDTGAGLSIVKTLVEALRGRIWVDSEPGIGTTFSVLLPISALEIQPDEAGEPWL